MRLAITSRCMQSIRGRGVSSLKICAIGFLIPLKSWRIFYKKRTKQMKTYKIYLDSCCVSRPYDSQTQNRIKSETTAVMQILSRFWSGEWQAITSKILQIGTGDNYHDR